MCLISFYFRLTLPRLAPSSRSRRPGRFGTNLTVFRALLDLVRPYLVANQTVGWAAGYTKYRFPFQSRIWYTRRHGNASSANQALYPPTPSRPRPPTQSDRAVERGSGPKPGFSKPRRKMLRRPMKLFARRTLLRPLML